MNFIPSPEGLSHIFAEASAPAFLLAGVAAFISVLMSRLGDTIDRLRSLKRIGADQDSTERDSEILHLKQRALLLHKATYLALIAGIVTTFLLMVMVASAFLGLQHAFGAPLLFAIASVLLSLSLYRFSQEIRIALHEIDQF
ncbi:uncharacterized protein DUF2721 [Roseiarcus fermentans]|uniref:Uncharacterized protein DUF2721 n=1 Tax=Roseiarcus fermentans TaxID=1473586 RepID=A0A366FPL4_9HYPH|nr:DUF2721 domain-containing protein [Roseiarcus fermentans]RBP16501.1 uncharacterized protein DUF2721 [Roseiarcus fermentans]